MPGLPGCELLCSCHHLSFWCPGSLAHAAHRRPACLGQHSGAMRAEHCLQPVLSKPAKRHALPRNGLGGSMRLVIASRTRATARHPTANALPGAATVHAACVSTASHTAQGAPWCEREGSPAGRKRSTPAPPGAGNYFVDREAAGLGAPGRQPPLIAWPRGRTQPTASKLRSPRRIRGDPHSPHVACAEAAARRMWQGAGSITPRCC